MRADAAQNRQRVLDVARAQLAAGDDSLQLNAIARLAGMGVGTVYRHFPNRHALVEALQTDRFQRFVDRARAASAETDAARGLSSLLDYTVEQTVADPGFAAVLESTDPAGATAAMKVELEHLLTLLLERAREAGLIRPDITADDLRRMVCGVGHAVHSGADGSRASRLYLEVLLNGLRP
jgi:AcrR family transcriptional regulator